MGREERVELRTDDQDVLPFEIANALQRSTLVS